MKFGFYICLLTLLFFRLSFAQKLPADPVDDFVKLEMKLKGIPGLAFAVIKNNEVVKMNAFGYANLDHSTPTTTKTVFPIASIDKQLIAACIMMLQEQGKLNIEEHVSKYLDSLPASWKDMKIRQLLSHTSGLPDDPIEYYQGKGFDRYTSKDIYSHIIKQDLTHPSGEKFLYSDSGFFLLQQIFERASGLYYPTFIQDRIFSPLQMQNTRILEPTEIVSGRTVSYYRDSGSKLYINVYRQISMGPHFSDIGTTIEDFVGYDLAINSNKFLKKETYDLMWTPATVNGGRTVSQLEDENDLFYANASYGLGWELGEFRGQRVVYHSGFTGTSITKFPEQELTVLVLTNLTYRPVFNPNALARNIASFYLTPKTDQKDPIAGETPIVSIDTILEQLKLGKPDKSLFEEKFYSSLLKALSTYSRKIAQFKNMGKAKFEDSTLSDKGMVQTFRVDYQNGSLFYHLTFNNENLITLISIEQ